MRSYCEQRAEDVAAASAAYLWNILPGLIESTPCEGFERLACYIQTAIRAYFGDQESFLVPEPSVN
jgi:hypothetical protein